jgi:hypothetical protein
MALSYTRHSQLLEKQVWKAMESHFSLPPQPFPSPFSEIVSLAWLIKIRLQKTAGPQAGPRCSSTWCLFAFAVLMLLPSNVCCFENLIEFEEPESLILFVKLSACAWLHKEERAGFACLW